MKKVILVVLCCLLLVFTSCDNVKEAKSIVSEFYQNQKNKQYENSISLFESSVLEKYDTMDLIIEFEKVIESMGDLVEFKNIGFEIKKEGNREFVYLKYLVEYTKSKTQENFKLVKENDKYKIYSWKWNKI